MTARDLSQAGQQVSRAHATTGAANEPETSSTEDALKTDISDETSDARIKPLIRVVPGEIHKVVDAAESALTNMGRYYQRGGFIGNRRNRPRHSRDARTGHQPIRPRACIGGCRHLGEIRWPLGRLDPH